MKKGIMAFLHDEKGDMVQNIAWLVAVSIGAVVVGGLIYQGIKGFGQRTINTLDNINPPQPSINYD